MTELTIRRIAMSLIADSYRYLESLTEEERTIALTQVRGIVTMANELIAALETDGDANASS